MLLNFFLFLCFLIYVQSNNSTDLLFPNDERIVGGVPVEITYYRYQGSLEHWHRHTCGVSLISNRWLVTAAHCVFSLPTFAPTQGYTVRLGTSSVQTEGFVYTVAKIIAHPLYNSTSYDFDIALIQLSRNVTIGSTVEPIPLADSNQALVPGTICTITGWGKLTFGGSSPAKLHMVQAPLISNENCENYYSKIPAIGPGRITDKMMCAGSPDGGRDACQGDSGGPLVNRQLLAGVVSWGYQCAVAKAPGVYASIPAFRDWIRETSGV